MNAENRPFLIAVGALGVILLALVIFLVVRSHGGGDDERAAASGGMPRGVADEFSRRMQSNQAGQAAPSGVTTAPPPGRMSTMPPGYGGMPGGAPISPPHGQ